MSAADCKPNPILRCRCMLSTNGCMVDHTLKRRTLVRPKGENQWCTLDVSMSMVDVATTFDISDEDVWEIMFVSMTDAEVEAQGEFDGW